MSVLIDKLKSFDYYKDKLPIYLQNSYGFIEHFRIWHDLLIGQSENTGVVGASDTMLDLLDIFSDDYLDKLNALEDSENGTKSDLLDKLGGLFGLRRGLKVTYIDDTETVSENITLDNKDFLLLIKAQIIKNYCNGTYAQIKEYYEKSGLYIVSKNASSPATLNIYLNNIEGSSYEYSENVKKMFLAGLLNIKSMGIQYNYSIQMLQELLIWDSSVKGWDQGAWAI